VTGGKPIAVSLKSISGVNAVIPLVAFYDIHGRVRGAILLFCPGHHTRRILSQIKTISLNRYYCIHRWDGRIDTVP
jgi:hypothetical protein